MVKFAAIIPARYGSTRFPGKPLAEIHGVTMIERVHSRAKQVFEHVYVATDDSRIEEQVRRFGGNVIMTKADHPSGTDRIAEALTKIAVDFDAIINIQGDEPFIDPQQLRQIQSLFDDPATDIATLIKPIEAVEDVFDTNCVKVVVDNAGFALYFSRQAIPFQRNVELSKWASSHQYFRHIGLYGYRTDVLKKLVSLPLASLEKAESLEQLRWLQGGYKIKTAITTCPSFGIDTPQDLLTAEKLIK